MDHVAYKSKDYFYGVHDYDHWLFAMIHIPHIQYSKALAPQKQILQDWPVDLSSVSLASASRHILAIRPCFWTRDMRSRLWELSQQELMGKLAHFYGVDLFWLWIGTWWNMISLNGSIRKRNSKLMWKTSEPPWSSILPKLCHCWSEIVDPKAVNSTLACKDGGCNATTQLSLSQDSGIWRFCQCFLEVFFFWRPK